MALKNGQVGFLVKKDMKYSETYEKIFLRFLVSQIWSILYAKCIKSWLQYHHKLLKFDSNLSFAPILLTTRSKSVSEYYKKTKKKFAKISFDKFFFFTKKNSSKSYDKNCKKRFNTFSYYGGSSSRPRMNLDWISLANLKSTISQKLNNAKSENCFFIGFRTLLIFCDQKR